jgi:phenazine biosynthesis protein phzE
MTITIVNNEDDFAHMVGHMLRVMGAKASVVDTFAYHGGEDKSDLLIVGPGPGDPTDMKHPRMKRLQEILAQTKNAHKRVLGICLGFQAYAFSEGLAVQQQEKSTQGVQREVQVMGEPYRLGFYNSFSPVFDGAATRRPDLKFDLDENGRIIAMQGNRFIGFQFHPESIMSEHGAELVRRAIMMLKIAAMH